jgi:hypothetical protein
MSQRKGYVQSPEHIARRVAARNQTLFERKAEREQQQKKQQLQSDILNLKRKQQELAERVAVLEHALENEFGEATKSSNQ